MNNNFSITRLEYIDVSAFDEESFLHRDARIMDKFSKLAVTLARKLFIKAGADEFLPERLGVVLATATGPYLSVRALNREISENGYISVNPSKFPNIMLSTPLSRVTTAIKARGPSAAMYIVKRANEALKYCVTQIQSGRCDGFLVLYIDEDVRCFGVFIEADESALNRGMKLRCSFSAKDLFK